MKHWYVKTPTAIETLLNSADDEDFEFNLMQIRNSAANYDVMARTGFFTSLVIGLLVGLPDPFNLLPASILLKLKTGVGVANLLRNLRRAAIIGVGGNVLQEEAVFGISAGGRPISRTEANLMAAGTGAAFGTLLGFLGAPNFRGSARGLLKRMPSTKSITDIDAALVRAFTPPKKAKGVPEHIRNYVGDLTESEQALRFRLEKTPTENASDAVLIRHGDDNDINAGLLERVKAHYRKAGHEYEVDPHPLQEFYDAASPIERTLNNIGQKVRGLKGVQKDALTATSAELADTLADKVAMQGMTLASSAASFFTPLGRLDRSALGAVHVAARLLWPEGTVSKAAALADPDGYRGVISAEMFREFRIEMMHAAWARLRESYAPNRGISAFLKRNAQDKVRPSAPEKLAAFMQREAITYTDIHGENFSIKPYRALAEYERHIIKIMMERKAHLTFGGENKQAIPQQMEDGIAAIQGFFGSNDKGMLDTADLLGVLPGKRAMKLRKEIRDAEISKIVDLEQEAREIADSVGESVPLQTPGSQKLFHGTALQPLDQFVDSRGNLHLQPSDSFGTGEVVSLSSSLGEATDFSTRVKGTPRDKRAGMVFEIDRDAITTARQQNDTEFTAEGEVVIPAGKWRVVPDDVTSRRAMNDADRLKSMSDEELAEAFAGDVSRSEVHEFERADVDFVTDFALNSEVLRRAGEGGGAFESKFIADANASGKSPVRIDEAMLPQATKRPASPAGSTQEPAARRSQLPPEWDHRTLRQQANGRLVDRNGNPIQQQWYQDMTTIRAGADPQLIGKMRKLSGEIWPVEELIDGKHWNTTHWFVPKKLVDEARLIGAIADEVSIQNRLGRAYADLDVAEDRLFQAVLFNRDAEYYFTRRWLGRKIQENRSGYHAALIRGWEKARSRGYDEDGNIIEVFANDRPIDHEVRARMARDGNEIPEVVRNEGDLQNRPELLQQYEDAIREHYRVSAESTSKKITDAENSHGIEMHFEGGPVFKSRSLVIDESDPAILDFLDLDPERVMGGYFNTMGGRLATLDAVRRGKHLFGEDAAARIDNPEDMVNYIEEVLSEAVEVASMLHKATGKDSALAARTKNDMDTVLKRMRNTLDKLEGNSLVGTSIGANSTMAFAGRTALTAQYFASLGLQVLAATQDVAALTLFTEITSVPRNVKFLVQAFLPLKNATRKELRLMGIGIEGEQGRVLATGDINFAYDDPTFSGVGVGEGRTRAATTVIGAGTGAFSRFFNEATLINTWNRFIKSAAGMIAMDRLATNSKRMIKVQDLMDGGMTREAAIRKAGFPDNFTYARTLEMGFDVARSRELLDLIYRYGTDQDGRQFASDLNMSMDEFLNYKGLALPNAEKWLKAEGDKARGIHDHYMVSINTAVERAMVITPGLGDRPLINDAWWGRAFNQFQSFNFAWANQVARPMAQRPASKQMATVSGYFASAAMVDAIRNEITGRRSFDETAQLWTEQPMAMTSQIVKSSGLLGWFGRPVSFLDRIGLDVTDALTETTTGGRQAYSARSQLGILAPVLDSLDRVIYGSTGWVGDREMSLSRWHALRRVMPLNNLVWFKLSTTYAGFDPYLTQKMTDDKYKNRDIRP